MADFKSYYELMEQARIANRAAFAALKETVLNGDGKTFAERVKKGCDLLNHSLRLRAAALAAVRESLRH
jgi:hypothetical protein